MWAGRFENKKVEKILLTMILLLWREFCSKVVGMLMCKSRCRALNTVVVLAVYVLFVSQRCLRSGKKGQTV